MSRCIVNVATGPYGRGQDRLIANQYVDVPMKMYRDVMPPGSPSHLDVPYAMKAWALKAAADEGATALLWADACILPIRSMEPLWEKIERDGYWISRNGWQNSEWTADSAYADIGVTREENEQIPHVVATTFGLSLAHPTGKAIFDEYLRLAQTKAFCGPWMNKNHPDYTSMPVNGRCAPCGPPTTRGHRHDQTALSCVAYKAGVTLTDPPNFFAYRGGEVESTVLVADATY